MKTVLVIQNKLPPYRDFLWEGLRKSFLLYLAEIDSNIILHPDGRSTTFHNFEFANELDCLVLNAGIREWINGLKYARRYRSKRRIGWTQFVGESKSLFSRLIKSVYLTLFFDKVLLYYEYEKELVPLSNLKLKCIALNNTVSDFLDASRMPVERHSFLFLGRFTEKSKLTLLLEAAKLVPDMDLHIIGIQRDELPSRLHLDNVHYHGNIVDLIRIRDIAASCTYFIYPGNVGLSIVHAVKLGLIPIVHADLDTHMPECRAVSQNFPVIYFQKDDLDSLINTIKLMILNTPLNSTKRWISLKGQQLFPAELMVSNFANAVEDH